MSAICWGGYNVVNEFGECASFLKVDLLQVSSIDDAMIAMENYGIGGFPWNKLFLNSIIRDNKISFNEQYAAHEDKLFLLKYLQCIKRVCIFPSNIYNYYQRSNGLSANYKNLRLRIYAIIDCIKVAKNTFDNEAYAKELRWAGAWMKIYLIRCCRLKSYGQFLNKDRILTLRKFSEILTKYFFVKMFKIKL